MATRISSLSSGMPIDTWVTDLLKPRQAQINSLEQKQTLLVWKQEDYQAIYKTDSTLGSLAFQDTLDVNIAPLKAVSSNETVATATATTGTAKLSHRLTVQQLADSVYLASSGSVTTGTDKSTLATQFGITADFNVKINGKSISVSKDASINTFVSSINSANVGVTAIYNATIDRFFLSTVDKGAWDGTYGSRVDFAGTSTAGMDFFNNNLDLPISANVASNATITTTGNAKTSLATQFGLTPSTAMSITVNGKPVSFNTDDAIGDLMTNINSTTGVGVTASYSADLDRVIFTGTGTTPKVDFTGSTDMSFLSSNLKVTSADSRMVLGQDAIVDIDGAADLHVLDNTFTLSGVTYNLKAAGSTSIDVMSDVDKALETAKAFVKQYNDTLEANLTEYNEVRAKQPGSSTNGFSYYMPLSAAQRKEMSETEIAAWEAKAKTGMLNNSQILGGTMDRMRLAISQPITGATGNYKDANSIGIAPAPDWQSYSEGGKLYLDEAKFRAALADDPGALKTVFGTAGTTTAKQGIAVRMKAVMDQAKTAIAQEAGIAGSVQTGFLGTQISDYSQQIYDVQQQMSDEESRYYNQFNAMEYALQKLSAQSSWLAQQTSTSSSSSG